MQVAFIIYHSKISVIFAYGVVCMPWTASCRTNPTIVLETQCNWPYTGNIPLVGLFVCVLHSLLTYLSTGLPICLFSYLCACLPALLLPTYIPACLPPCMPVHLTTYLPQIKQRKSQPLRRFGYPVIISIPFDDLTSQFIPSFLNFDWEDTSNTRDSVSSAI